MKKISLVFLAVVSCLFNLSIANDAEKKISGPIPPEVIAKTLQNPFMEAAYLGDVKQLKEFLDKGTPVDTLHKSGMTALMYAVYKGHFDACELLLKAGADVNGKAAGYKSIHEAAMYGHVKIAELLIKYGAKVDVTDRNGTTPLHLASQEGKTEMCSFLLSKGVDINAKAEDGKTALHFAAERGQYEAIELLLKHGANWSCRDKKGNYPLHLAAGANHGVGVIILVSEYINAVDNEGNTPLHNSVKIDNFDAFEILVKVSNVNLQNKDGNTALHLVVPLTDARYIPIFLANGADKSIKNKDGKTAYDLAIETTNKVSIELLK